VPNKATADAKAFAEALVDELLAKAKQHQARMTKPGS